MFPAPSVVKKEANEKKEEPKEEPKAAKKKETIEYKVHDPREHLNVVFIGHVGTDFMNGLFPLFIGSLLFAVRSWS